MSGLGAVLIPRGGEWGEEAARVVRERGGEPVVADVITFEPPRDPAPLHASVAALEAGVYDWLILTSPRAVSAVFAALPSNTADSAGLDGPSGSENVAGRTYCADNADSADTTADISDPLGPSITADTVGPTENCAGDGGADELATPNSRRVSHNFRRGRGGIPTHTQIAAVGDATAAAIRAHGYEPAFIPREQSARGLVREWPGKPGARILWPRSSQAAPTIAAGFVRVDDPVAYRTVGTPLSANVRERIQSATIAATLVTSGSVARQLAADVPAAPTAFITIGPSTTRDARAAGLTVSAEASERTVAAMLDAYRQFRGERP